MAIGSSENYFHDPSVQRKNSIQNVVQKILSSGHKAVLNFLNTIYWAHAPLKPQNITERINHFFEKRSSDSDALARLIYK